ncbi:MAG: hypothetical protein A2096_17715 [Spirochaetes bacterium GWF1_41_5]|nr:MAG: hypothetical protein A2096_17715 [Spirochaetes bacterium GWF1_41_5]HBE01726.1 hypothetical protein [Spirochaetia bacterium]
MNTIKNIAKLAGVSVGSVSNVLNNKSSVKPQIRNTILQIINDTGYIPNNKARALARRTKNAGNNLTRQVGILFPVSLHIFSNPYFGLILEGLRETLIASQFSIAFMYSFNEMEDPFIRAKIFDHEQYDGIIILGAIEAKKLASLRQYYQHLVNIYNYQQDEIDSVCPDRIPGCMSAMQYLIDHGHREFFFSGGYKTEPAEFDKERLDAFFAAHKKNHLELRKDHILAYGNEKKFHEMSIATPQAEMDNALIDFGYKKAIDVLTLRRGKCAVFCHNDYIACGMLRYFNKANIAVPEEIAVLGYNDDAVCTICNPPLSTIAVPKKELGIIGAKHFINSLKLNDKSEMPVRITVNTYFLRRASC